VKEPFIALAPLGVFGMHPSLLPRHRGRAPIPWTILSGLTKTGVTLFEIVDPTADTGLIVGQAEVPIESDETASTLFEKTKQAHLALIDGCIPLMLEGRAPRIPQDGRRASSWPRRIPADGIIDWETRAQYLYDWIRAQTRPYPGAFTYLGDVKLIIWRAVPVEADHDLPSGTVLESSAEGVVVACGAGSLLLQEVEPEGSAPICGREIGEMIRPGTTLG
jgi:methionyl-tRNA formyltransferase